MQLLMFDIILLVVSIFYCVEFLFFVDLGELEDLGDYILVIRKGY